MKPIAISPVDAVFAAGGYPIEFLLIYERGLDTRRLRRALPALARAFWPAFGTLEGAAIRPRRYDESRHYEEVTVPLTVDASQSLAELHEHFEPHVPRGMPGLVFFRVLRFRRGGALLFRMSHVAGDGYSVFFLLSTLAAMTRLARWPLSGRALAALARPHHRRPVPGAPPLAAVPPPSGSPSFAPRIETERIPRADLDRRVASLPRDGSVRVSHNDLLSALVLRRTVERQRGRFGERVRLSLPIDVRRHVPACGPRFFGNGLLFHHADFGAERVLSATPEDLAAEIRASMPRVSPASYAGFLRGLAGELAGAKERLSHPYDPDRGCLVTNLSRLPIQRLDFGRGRPARVLPLTVADNSAAVLREGDHYLLRLVRAASD